MQSLLWFRWVSCRKFIMFILIKCPDCDRKYWTCRFGPSSLQATNEVVGRVPKATQGEMLAAVDSCSRAFRSWSETSILNRQQIFLRYQQLIKDNIVGKSTSATCTSSPKCSQICWTDSLLFIPGLFQKELAKIITLEQGKTLADAEGDVFRGLRK